MYLLLMRYFYGCFDQSSKNYYIDIIIIIRFMCLYASIGNIFLV